MGIKDIPDTLEDLETWTAEYTKQNVYFTENDRKCAQSTMRVFLRDIPPFMRGLAQHAAVLLLETQTRVALGYEDSPHWIASLVSTAFQIRRFVIRYLFLARLYELDPLAKPDSTGRLFRDTWVVEPWYIKVTVKNRLEGWFWTSGKALPGPKYKSYGFLVEELGPVEYAKSSKKAVAKEAKEMQAYAGATALRCPFCPAEYSFKYGA